MTTTILIFMGVFGYLALLAIERVYRRDLIDSRDLIYFIALPLIMFIGSVIVGIGKLILAWVN